MSAGQGAGEWRKYWTLPIAAGFGYSMSVLQTYAFGPFIPVLDEEFGWGRAAISFGLTIANIGGALTSVGIGALVDRFGPRVVGLIGALTTGGAFALLGTTSGSIAHYFLLWGVFAILAPPVQASVWSSAVASRFAAARGMALGVMLTGASVGAFLFPYMSARLIEAHGWRSAFAIAGGGWAALVFVVLFFFFRGARDAGKQQRAAAADTGLAWREGLKQPALYKLALVCILYTITTVGMSVHFVPILMEKGVERVPAAEVASLLGIFAVFGRLLIGLLLDRFPGRFVGAFVFLFSIAGATLLLLDGANPSSQAIAAGMFGLALGAEIDVVTYLAARHFGLKNFGVLYGGLIAALSIGVAIGPLTAGAIFDAHQSYALFLALTMVLTIVSALTLLTLGRPPAAQPAPAS